ncbi:hypothetical protein QE152_g30437 [Popillia japonica]|uniref:Uncharacterized protein n=1 Tax=Popillia japonica TaxID=7064 RepID=A0AAW1JED8_POPJA
MPQELLWKSLILNLQTHQQSELHLSFVSFPAKIYYHPSTSKVHSLAITTCRANFARTTVNSQPFSQTSLCSKTVSSKKPKLTKYKALATISPIPCSLSQSKVKGNISAANVISPEYIASKRKKNQETLEKKEKKEQNNQVATSKVQKGKLPRGRKSKRLKHDSPPSDEDSTKMELLSDTVSESRDEACVECLEIYALTTSQSDWIKCISYGKCLYESSTFYQDTCYDCGRKETCQKNSKK